jgi:predicted Zn-dependent peptidase
MGILKINFASTNPNTQYIISIILSYLNALSKNGLSKERLKYFKQSFLNRTKYIFADESMKEMWHGNSLFYGLNITKDDYIKMIKNLSNDDIKGVCKHVFNFKRMGVATCGKYNTSSMEKEIIDIKNTYTLI